MFLLLLKALRIVFLSRVSVLGLKELLVSRHITASLLRLSGRLSFEFWAAVEENFFVDKAFVLGG